ncbi:pyridoxamine 5'-phosphate oxidase family protein [Microbacterium album]|uniref:pyridoxamine 5'-phosphate oxidase family protein n=1 Tax=Microbacterium album TaxID=2053191 RepID=UPI001E5822F6|nr:pyridoxamine 5'-phosphate oxidase family protein [Microbacterium album]
MSEQESLDLLPSASVGRLGFVDGGEVQIIPANYTVEDRGVLVVRTSSDGILSRLAHASPRVAFEVDYHDDHRGVGWSVLMNGSLRAVDDDEESPHVDSHRVIPWAGTSRTLRLRFRAQRVTGRQVRRVRDPLAEDD